MSQQQQQSQRRSSNNGNTRSVMLLPKEDGVRYPCFIRASPRQREHNSKPHKQQHSKQSIHDQRQDKQAPHFLSCSPLTIGRNALANSPGMSPVAEANGAITDDKRMMVNTHKDRAQKVPQTDMESSFNAILSKSLSPKVPAHSPHLRAHLDDTLSVANILEANGLLHLCEIFKREEVREFSL